MKYVDLFNEKVVLTMSNDKKHFFHNLFDSGNWDMQIVVSVCDEVGNFR